MDHDGQSGNVDSGNPVRYFILVILSLALGGWGISTLGGGNDSEGGSGGGGGGDVAAAICITSTSRTSECETTSYSGPSPLPVFFEAWLNSSHVDTTINAARFYMLTYNWDFDDAASGTWDPTGNSRNLMTGPLAGHVFEPSSFPDDCGGVDCAIFTVGLTVRDDAGSSDTDSVTINVYDPEDATEGWGSNTKSVCVSRTSDFTDCPSAAAQHSSETGDFEDIVLAKAAAHFTRILFHGGQTWDWAGELDLRSAIDAGPGLIGSFGASKANLNVTIDTARVLINDDADDWRFQDFYVDGVAQHYLGFLLLKGGIGARNFLFQRVEYADDVFGGIINGRLQDLSAGDDQYATRNLFFVDNVIGKRGSADPDACHLFGVYGLFYAGNDLAGCETGGNEFRTYGRSQLITNNHFGPQGTAQTSSADGKSVMTLRHNGYSEGSGCTAGGPLCDNHGVWETVIQDNNIGCQGSACIDVGHNAGTGTDPLSSRNVIVERNFFYKEGDDTRPTFLAVSLTQDVECRDFDYAVIRNNLWAGGSAARYLGTQAFMIGCGGDYTAVYGNSCLDLRTSGAGNSRCAYGDIDWAHNNVLWAPNWTGTIEVVAGGSENPANASFSNNAENGGSYAAYAPSNGQVELTACPWANCAVTMTRADFEIDTDSELYEAGTLGHSSLPGGMILDVNRNVRDSSTPDMGAYEYVP